MDIECRPRTHTSLTWTLSPSEEIESTVVAETKWNGGGFADVWRGTWVKPDGTAVLVAVKYLRYSKMGTLLIDDPEASRARMERASPLFSPQERDV